MRGTLGREHEHLQKRQREVEKKLAHVAGIVQEHERRLAAGLRVYVPSFAT